jgi:ribonuclease HI
MAAPRVILVHADESCLGNGRAGPNPGGAGGLVEVRHDGVVVRRDYFVAEPDTTNNRMAIRSAILALELLGARGKPLAIQFVSDSEYLVKGMTTWMPGWVRRNWKNVKNPELWQQLRALAAPPHDVRWRWVRGHDEHPKNEYADFLATRAAREQRDSGGLVESGFGDWLAAQRAKGRYHDLDPDGVP